MGRDPAGISDPAAATFPGRHAETLVQVVQRHELLLNGDPDKDVKGIRSRLTDVETFIRLLRDTQLQVKGLTAGLLVNVLLSLVALAKLFGWLP